MSHPRAVMREQVRAALTASPDLEGVTVFRSWAQSIGREEHPAIGVVTPREQADMLTGSETQKRVTLVVQYRARGGDDLEDHLDDVSAIIEPLVLAVLEGSQQFGIDSTDIEITGEGGKKVGLLNMSFSAERYALEGLAE